MKEEGEKEVKEYGISFSNDNGKASVRFRNKFVFLL
jgi:hypothetical protein